MKIQDIVCKKSSYHNGFSQNVIGFLFSEKNIVHSDKMLKKG